MAAGIGRHQLEVNHWALEMGGHCRTGLEDNVRWDKNTLAKSNAQLVGRVAELCAQYNRPVADAKQAREMLPPAPGGRSRVIEDQLRHRPNIGARVRWR